MDIQELVRAQRAYFDTGATRPYAFRLLRKNLDEGTGISNGI